MNDFYVYLLFRPEGPVCYVGKGKGDRWRHGTRGHYGNPHLMNIVRKAGGELPVAFVRKNMSEDEAFILERKLISDLGRIKDGGPLVNLGEGGEGKQGPKSETARNNMRKSHWNKNNHPETADAISTALKGRSKSPSHKEALKKAKRPHLEEPISEKRRLGIRGSLLRFWEQRRQKFNGSPPSLRSEEGHKRHSETMRARFVRNSNLEAVVEDAISL